MHLDLPGVHTARGRDVVVLGKAAWDDDGEIRAARPQHRVRAGAWSVLR
jgi:hypothetical protein